MNKTLPMIARRGPNIRGRAGDLSGAIEAMRERTEFIDLLCQSGLLLLFRRGRLNNWRQCALMTAKEYRLGPPY
jgi:hypothetical protein